MPKGLAFTKWHGCGNDFVFFIDMKDELADKYDMSQLAVKLCDRHFGVGADGVILILPPRDADANDFRMRIINSDGSEAEMCGNGTRMFAKLAYEAGLTDKDKFRVETGAGIIIPKINVKDGAVESVTVDMGEPILNGPAIPVSGYGDDKVVRQSITVDGREFKMTCVSMGNPHAVVFMDSEEDCDLIETFGRNFEVHPAFPAKTNTHFCYVRDDSHIRMRVWERGAAMTLACGTGSCAVMTAAVLEGRTGKSAEIELDGGILQLEWREDNHLYMTGPAVKVFEGVLNI
ncbi:MAG: diaminopimelate epimerase [Selenomonadaceae bacterium]|nr:diaminopimelate epimerase [Selenomonadaceae bacterium]